MLILVSGGSASGKSKYAEDLVVQAPPGGWGLPCLHFVAPRSCQGSN